MKTVIIFPFIMSVANNVELIEYVKLITHIIAHIQINSQIVFFVVTLLFQLVRILKTCAIIITETFFMLSV